LSPFCFLLAFARIVIVALTFETKNFAADAGDCIDMMNIYLNTVTAIDASTKLIITISCDKHFA